MLGFRFFLLLFLFLWLAEVGGTGVLFSEVVHSAHERPSDLTKEGDSGTGLLLGKLDVILLAQLGGLLLGVDSVL